MKGFFKWFKNSSKMKRWMLIILIGIIFACIGISKIIVAKTISFAGVGKVIALFVVGFTMIVVGLTCTQKRILEILIEDTDYRMENGSKERNVKSLIFNKKIYNEGPKVVVIGGGSGLNTILKGLKKYTSNITAIVNVPFYEKENSKDNLVDSRMNDIKESIIALARNEDEMSELFNIKLDNFRNLSFSDIFFTSMNERYKNISEAVEKSKDILNIVGKVLPVTLDKMQICAELKDGTIIENKERIPELVYSKVSKIERIFLNPSNCSPAPGVLEAIKDADAIIIGPGSLYTNIISNLLVKNISKTIKESNAIKIYISNIMTEPGQTDNYTLYDHIKAIIDHAGNEIIDYCIYDSGDVIPEFIKIYNKRGADVVEQDIQKAKEFGIKFIGKDLSQVVGDNIRHDTQSVAESIIELVCDDLRFKDEQNDPKFIMLNTKLREEKRFEKIKRQNKKKENSKYENTYQRKGNSKFSNKYRERIRSIQESDFKREQNKRLLKEEEENKKENVKEEIKEEIKEVNKKNKSKKV